MTDRLRDQPKECGCSADGVRLCADHKYQAYRDQIAELEAERDDLAARLEAVTGAARSLIDYEETGAPAFLDWDERFENLRDALDGEGGD